MQVFKSDYWERGVRVSDKTPTRELRHRLGRTSVGRSTHHVVEEVLDAIEYRVVGQRNTAGWTFDLARDTVRFAVWQHLENRAEYQYVWNGPLSAARIALYQSLYEAAVKSAYERLIERGMFA